MNANFFKNIIRFSLIYNQIKNNFYNTKLTCQTKKGMYPMLPGIILVLGLLLLPGLKLSAQNNASFELGNGLNFSLNEGNYHFKFSGLIQPLITINKMEGQKNEYILRNNRTYLNFSGIALKEKVGFFVQTDFSASTPLLDAWIAYNPLKSLTITFGQKQSIANNREMLVMEDKLQFSDRGLLSSGFCRSGRELGVSITQTISISSMCIIPQIAVSSGDGQNSFGADSRDVDLGGFKYAGRLDIYPFGIFSEGNNDQISDLIREPKPKMVLGIAASYNVGASNAVGEGHNDFQFYDEVGKAKYPDYRKLYADILFKYKGFSLLGELAIATATALEGSYTSTTSVSRIIPTQISEYLALGKAYNVQAGYIFKNGFALDTRYEMLRPEFEKNTSSIIRNADSWTFGISKYIKGNSLKIHTDISTINYKDNNQLIGTLGMQIVF